MNKGRIFQVVFLILCLLFASFPSASAIQSHKVSEALVIRADRIESKGLGLGLGPGNHGLVIKLNIQKAVVSGMNMGGSYVNGQSRWNVNVKDSEVVTIHGLSLDVSAIGFKMKPDGIHQLNAPLQVDSLLPTIVLHDVYLRVEHMKARDANMSSLALDTTKDVSLERPKDGIFIDLRSISTKNKEEMKHKINQMLSGEMEKDKKDNTSQEKEGVNDPGKAPPPDGEDPSDSEEGLKEPDHNDGSKEEKITLKRYFTALEIVKTAKRYQSTIVLKQEEKEFNAKEWGKVVLMKRFPGTVTEVVAKGSDAKKAVQGMVQFLTEK
ncbi:HPr family phosphocarrier protein [Melghirimyces algeriensis]|uniref:Phosphotransferase system, HPr n=1 Tax=Melghirimyces algeriensis TaxID=910412 RepID=A0A521DZ14_9BACL|nr:HPr family phosphocarrier protein [Melghirimyces algeriensis]SMO76868.1 Phosphotransferase system, HPr [Melghirimyces algeriensis]